MARKAAQNNQVMREIQLLREELRIKDDLQPYLAFSVWRYGISMRRTLALPTISTASVT